MSTEVRGFKGAANDKENSGPSDNNDSHRQSAEKTPQDNLFTKVISFGGRSYYLDVRENKWGRYLKLTESSSKRRNTILLSGHVVSVLIRTLDDIIKGNFKPREVSAKEDKWQTVYSRSANSFKKKIYIDLMENKFGRSLNIAEISENRPKSCVIITEHGWLQLQRALKEISENFSDFAPREVPEKGTLLASKKLNVGSKVLFFDLMENELGSALKLSEIRKGRRERIFIPDVALHPIKLFLKKLSEGNFEDDVSGLEKAQIEDTAQAEEQETQIITKRTLKLETDNPADTKVFYLELRENNFGRFLKISELKNGRKRAVFIPAECFNDCFVIIEEIEAMINEAAE